MSKVEFFGKISGLRRATSELIPAVFQFSQSIFMLICEAMGMKDHSL